MNSYYCPFLFFFFGVKTQTNSKTTTEGKGKTNNRWNEVRWANMKFPSCQLAIPCIPGLKVVYLLMYKSLNSLHIFKLGNVCGSFFPLPLPICTIASSFFENNKFTFWTGDHFFSFCDEFVNIRHLWLILWHIWSNCYSEGVDKITLKSEEVYTVIIENWFSHSLFST